VKVKFLIEFEGEYQFKGHENERDLLEGSLDQLSTKISEEIKHHFPNVKLIHKTEEHDI